MENKDKNQSFVEIKGSVDDKELDNLINPLKKYEYIEEKKSFFNKQKFLLLFLFIALALVIIFSILIDKNVDNILSKDDSKKNTNNLSEISTTTVTTTVVESIPTITESLKCSLSNENNGILQSNTVISNFSNKKLLNSLVTYNISLIDEYYEANYNSLISSYSLLALELDSNGLDVNEQFGSGSYSISFFYNFSSNIGNNNFFYGEDYSNVLNNFLNEGFICE